jgi:hypothetical protein
VDATLTRAVAQAAARQPHHKNLGRRAAHHYERALLMRKDMKRYLIIGALLISAITSQAHWYDEKPTPAVAAACQQAGQYLGGEGVTTNLFLGQWVSHEIGAAWQQAGQYAGGSWI